MALVECRFFSKVLGMATSMAVILPGERDQGTPPVALDRLGKDGRYRTLWLLHGLSDDHTAWMRRTSVERYAERYGVAVVMPEVQRSFYTDMAHGLRYWSFLSEELPRLARFFFPLSARREENFVAGLSMGGYGAFKWALRNPGTFAAAGSFSGALDMAHRSEEADEAWKREMADIFGEASIEGSDNDLLHLVSRLGEQERSRLRLFQSCGSEDFLLQANRRFRDHARRRGLDLLYEELPGAHEWGYWDAAIQRFLAWLFGSTQARGDG